MKQIIYLIMGILLIAQVFATDSVVGVFRDNNKKINLTRNNPVAVDNITIVIGNPPDFLFECDEDYFGAVWDNYNFIKIFYSNYTKYYMSISKDSEEHYIYEIAKNINQSYFDNVKDTNFSFRTNFLKLVESGNGIVFVNATPPTIDYAQEDINREYLQHENDFANCLLHDKNWTKVEPFFYDNFGYVTYHEKVYGLTHWY